MNQAAGMHRTLARQLRRLNLDGETSPSPAAWRELLDVLSASYAETEEDRYTLERSIDVSSQEMRGLHEVLSRQASQDALTGLPNRASMIRHLNETLAACSRTGDGLAVLFIDLDGFKQVNDSLGHAVGDDLLVLASQRIRACLRPEDVVARLGGDEFVVVCPNVSDRLVIPSIAARIGSQLAAPFPIGRHQAVVSASIGLTMTTDITATAENLLRQADLAMYEAKLSGKGRSYIFNESMQLAADTKFSVRNALSRAVPGHELRVLYQPIVSLVDEQVIGAEALVRWERPGFGLLTPEEFMPLTEESSLVAAVDCWVLLEACVRGAKWCEAGGKIAINLSARTLKQEVVVSTLRQALNESAISPGRLTLKVTESAVLGATGSAQVNLRRLRELGVKLSIDDFGTGHSSVSQVRGTDVDTLKIDRSFVATMDQDASSASIVGAIITFGHALGLTLVAEGVERPSQAALLRSQGCDAAQGGLYGQPQQAEAIDLAFDLASP